jgi:hypothetical protein
MVPALAWPAAVVAIALGIQTSIGEYEWTGVAWITLGLALTWLGLLTPAYANSDPIVQSAGVIACVIGAAVEWRQLNFSSPLLLRGPPATYYSRALPLLAVLGGLVFAGKWGRRFALPMLLVAYFLVGMWVLQCGGRPLIDVFEFTNSACQAISNGQNPYAADFPDPYENRPDWQREFYPPGVVIDGRVKFGYAYMPLTLEVEFVARAITGDFRVANLLSLVAAAGLLAFLDRSPMGSAAAVLLLLMPRNFAVIDYGWIEPVMVLCLAGVVFCAVRQSWLLPYAAGLFLVSKQHMFLAALLLLLLLPQPWNPKQIVAFFLRAGVTGVVVTLPMMLWNLPAFWHSAVAVQLMIPFRHDSLNLAAWWVRMGHAPPPAILPFVVAAAAVALALWRSPRTPAGFAASVAGVYLCFFLVAKQAFGNYYFFAIGALCCAMAAYASSPASELACNPSKTK